MISVFCNKIYGVTKVTNFFESAKNHLEQIYEKYKLIEELGTESYKLYHVAGTWNKAHLTKTGHVEVKAVATIAEKAAEQFLQKHKINVDYKEPLKNFMHDGMNCAIELEKDISSFKFNNIKEDFSGCSSSLKSKAEGLFSQVVQEVKGDAISFADQMKKDPVETVGQILLDTEEALISAMQNDQPASSQEL